MRAASFGGGSFWGLRSAVTALRNEPSAHLGIELGDISTVVISMVIFWKRRAPFTTAQSNHNDVGARCGRREIQEKSQRGHASDCRGEGSGFARQ